jgi:repressor LexA
LIEQKGFLTRTPRSSRSIRVVKQERKIEPSQMISVPVVGKIAAGLPIFAFEEAGEVLALPRKLFRGRSLFALRVEGDSMTKAGIFDDDIAVLRKQPDFTDGDIAAVIVDEEATLKRLFRTAKGLRLHPENDAYRDRIIPAAQVDRACRVAGILVGTIRRF